jgi:maleylpyruvate isomerase
MPSDTPQPTSDLAAVDAAFSMLLDATRALTDAQAREPSLLPGWTRGHLLTHIARSGEADAQTVEGAIRGEVVEKYPGGEEQRSSDIEAGAGRGAAALLEDLVTTQRALMDAWGRVEDGMWERLTLTPVGPRTVAGTVHARRREILVHLVDLDVGYSARDLPADYVDADRGWLVEYRTPATWADARW